MWKHNYIKKNALENILNIIVTNNLGNLLQGGIVGNSSSTMTWEEWLFLEASKETGGEFQMQRPSLVKKIHQDVLARSPTQAFLCSFSLMAGAATSRQVWRTRGWGIKVRSRWALQQEKNLWQKLESPCHMGCCICLYEHLSSGRRKMSGDRGQRKPICSILFWNCKYTHQTNVFWEPETVSSHCLATCSSSPSYSSVASLAYVGNSALDSGTLLPHVTTLAISWATGVVMSVKENWS